VRPISVEAEHQDAGDSETRGVGLFGSEETELRIFREVDCASL
jgi:hypothetical protein